MRILSLEGSTSSPSKSFEALFYLHDFQTRKSPWHAVRTKGFFCVESKRLDQSQSRGRGWYCTFTQPLPDKFIGLARHLVQMPVTLFFRIEHGPLAVFLQQVRTVSYTHLTLPTKRIV